MHRIVTVTVAATTQDLTVLETVKADLKILDASKDAQIAELIHDASADCAAYCSRVFGSETVEESIYDVEDDKSLILDRYPVTAIASVTVDGTALASTDWKLDADAGMLYRANGENWCGDIVITYTGGFELLGTLPRDIERACREQIKALYYTGGRDPTAKAVAIPGVISKEFWVGGMGSNGAVHPAVASRLDFYKKQERS